MSQLYQRYPALLGCREQIEDGFALLRETFENGGKLLVCGNGGSCADCDHIVGELMKGFLLPRPIPESFAKTLTEQEDGEQIASRLQRALPAISLVSHAAVLSAYANDVDPDMIYAQMVYGYGREGDLLLCLSTSGNSKNVVLAAETAKAAGLKTLALTGAAPSRLSEMCDVCIRVPETETFKVQELHLPIYHELCIRLEKTCFC